MTDKEGTTPNYASYSAVRSKDRRTGLHSLLKESKRMFGEFTVLDSRTFVNAHTDLRQKRSFKLTEYAQLGNGAGARVTADVYVDKHDCVERVEGRVLSVAATARNGVETIDITFTNADVVVMPWKHEGEALKSHFSRYTISLTRPEDAPVGSVLRVKTGVIARAVARAEVHVWKEHDMHPPPTNIISSRPSAVAAALTQPIFQPGVARISDELWISSDAILVPHIQHWNGLFSNERVEIRIRLADGTAISYTGKCGRHPPTSSVVPTSSARLPRRAPSRVTGHNVACGVQAPPPPPPPPPPRAVLVDCMRVRASSGLASSSDLVELHLKRGVSPSLPHGVTTRIQLQKQASGTVRAFLSHNDSPLRQLPQPITSVDVMFSFKSHFRWSADDQFALFKSNVITPISDPQYTERDARRALIEALRYRKASKEYLNQCSGKDDGAGMEVGGSAPLLGNCPEEVKNHIVRQALAASATSLVTEESIPAKELRLDLRAYAESLDSARADDRFGLFPHVQHGERYLPVEHNTESDVVCSEATSEGTSDTTSETSRPSDLSDVSLSTRSSADTVDRQADDAVADHTTIDLPIDTRPASGSSARQLVLVAKPASQNRRLSFSGSSRVAVASDAVVLPSVPSISSISSPSLLPSLGGTADPSYVPGGVNRFRRAAYVSYNNFNLFFKINFTSFMDSINFSIVKLKFLNNFYYNFNY